MILKHEQQSAIESKESMFAKFACDWPLTGFGKSICFLFVSDCMSGNCVAGTSVVSLSSCSLVPRPSPVVFLAAYLTLNQVSYRYVVKKAWGQG